MDEIRPPRVLVVEDDEALSAALGEFLGAEGFDVTCVDTGGAAVEQVAAGAADLLVLDVMLPDMDGFAVTRSVREIEPVPVLMLTARGEPRDKLRGFSSGADDYVVKPFDPAELVARIRALLRRSGRDAGGVLRVGALELRRERRTVSIGAHSAILSPREFDLLETLAAVPGHPLSRSQLVNRAWGPDADTDGRTVDTTVVRLRRKLEALCADGPPPVVISTLWGVGYRLDPQSPP